MSTCPIGDTVCEETKPKLRKCFAEKFRNRYGTHPYLDYACSEFSKYVHRGVYTIRDFAKTCHKLLREVFGENYGEDLEALVEYLKTLPCNLAFTYIVSTELTSLPQDFIEYAKSLYTSGSESLKKFIKTSVLFVHYLAERISASLLETCISLVDLQLISAISAFRSLMRTARAYYVLNGLLTYPLYLAYIDLANRGRSAEYKQILYAIAQTCYEVLSELEEDLLLYSAGCKDVADDLSVKVETLHSYVVSGLRSVRSIIFVTRIVNDVCEYCRLRRIARPDLSRLFRELTSSIDPVCIASPFNVYLYMSLLLEREIFRNVAADQLCTEYLSDKYTFTFRMYFPVNAVMDDYLTELVLELYLSQYESLLRALREEQGLALTSTITSLKEIPLTPSHKVVPIALQSILFLHSAILDLMTWAVHANSDIYWSFRTSSVKEDSRLKLIEEGRQYLIDRLNRVTELLYVVTTRFYMTERCEDLYNSYIDEMTNYCRQYVKSS